MRIYFFCRLLRSFSYFCSHSIMRTFKEENFDGNANSFSFAPWKCYDMAWLCIKYRMTGVNNIFGNPKNRPFLSRAWPQTKGHSNKLLVNHVGTLLVVVLHPPPYVINFKKSAKVRPKSNRGQHERNDPCRVVFLSLPQSQLYTSLLLSRNMKHFQ